MLLRPELLTVGSIGDLLRPTIVPWNRNHSQAKWVKTSRQVLAATVRRGFRDRTRSGGINMDTKASRCGARVLTPIAVTICLLLAGLRLAEKASGTYVVITIDVCWICGEDFQGTWNGKD